MLSIKKLQKKSRSTRLLFLWLATFLVMIIIIFIWLFSFSRNLSSQKIKEKDEVGNLPSLFESVEKDFSIFKQGLEANLKDITIPEE